jgi:hypothetical protein
LPLPLPLPMRRRLLRFLDARPAIAPAAMLSNPWGAVPIMPMPRMILRRRMPHRHPIRTMRSPMRHRSMLVMPTTFVATYLLATMRQLPIVMRHHRMQMLASMKNFGAPVAVRVKMPMTPPVRPNHPDKRVATDKHHVAIDGRRDVAIVRRRRIRFLHDRRTHDHRRASGRGCLHRDDSRTRFGGHDDDLRFTGHTASQRGDCGKGCNCRQIVCQLYSFQALLPERM